MCKYKRVPGNGRDQWRSALILVLAFTIGALAPTLWPSCVQAQQQPAGATGGSDKSDVKGFTDRQQSPVAKGGFVLRVDNKELIPTIKLVAKEARVSAIAAKLSSEITVPVKLSPAISKQKVSVDLDGLPLEALLRYLAPQPYVDYVAGGNDMGAKALAIYLYGLNENTPPLNETVKESANQSLFIQGDTEEGSDEYKKRKKEEPLEVAFSHNRLSVRAEKQPLTTVLARIATELGIPYDVGNDATEVVSVNFKDYPVDHAMRSLSPSIRFYYRADLTTFENQLTRVVLKSSSNSTSQTAEKN